MTTFYKNQKLKALLSNADSFAGLVWPLGARSPLGLPAGFAWGRGHAPCPHVAWPAGDKISKHPTLGLLKSCPRKLSWVMACEGFQRVQTQIDSMHYKRE